MHKTIFFILIFTFLKITGVSVPITTASEVEPLSMRNEKNIEQKFKELSDELQKQFIDAVDEFLEKELKHLKGNKDTPKESLHLQIEQYEKELESGPKNPETYFALARLYDQKGEGASAIIYAKKAEEIFLERLDVKGVAEARRSLRLYYDKYDYKPEDFKLNN